MDACDEKRYFVGAFYTILMVPCLVLQGLVVKVIWQSKMHRDSISFDTILRQSVINFMLVAAQVPLLFYSVLCISFPVVDQYVVLVYLTSFYSIEPYGLVLTLSRINIIAMRNVIPEVALKILKHLIFPGYLLLIVVITVFPNSNCGLFYYVYNWEIASDCPHQDMLDVLTKAVYFILGFNLIAYFVISSYLRLQRRQTQHSSRKTDLKAEQRVLLSTMSSFFSSFVLITGKLALSKHVNDVTWARFVYRLLVLISNNVFLFSLVFVNKSLRTGVLTIIWPNYRKKTSTKVTFLPIKTTINSRSQ